MGNKQAGDAAAVITLRSSRSRSCVWTAALVCIAGGCVDGSGGGASEQAAEAREDMTRGASEPEMDAGPAASNEEPAPSASDRAPAASEDEGTPASSLPGPKPLVCGTQGAQVSDGSSECTVCVHRYCCEELRQCGFEMLPDGGLGEYKTCSTDIFGCVRDCFERRQDEDAGATSSSEVALDCASRCSNINGPSVSFAVTPVVECVMAPDSEQEPRCARECFVGW